MDQTVVATVTQQVDNRNLISGIVIKQEPQEEGETITNGRPITDENDSPNDDDDDDGEEDIDENPVNLTTVSAPTFDPDCGCDQCRRVEREQQQLELQLKQSDPKSQQFHSDLPTEPMDIGAPTTPEHVPAFFSEDEEDDEQCDSSDDFNDNDEMESVETDGSSNPIPSPVMMITPLVRLIVPGEEESFNNEDDEEEVQILEPPPAAKSAIQSRIEHNLRTRSQLSAIGTRLSRIQQHLLANQPNNTKPKQNTIVPTDSRTRSAKGKTKKAATRNGKETQLNKKVQVHSTVKPITMNYDSKVHKSKKQKPKPKQCIEVVEQQILDTTQDLEDHRTDHHHHHRRSSNRRKQLNPSKVTESIDAQSPRLHQTGAPSMVELVRPEKLAQEAPKDPILISSGNQISGTVSSVGKKFTQRIVTLQLQCTQAGCGRWLADKAELDKHLEVDHELGKHRCLVGGCGQSFDDKLQFALHKETAHRVSGFICGQCQYRSRVYSLLASHHHTTHAEGHFACGLGGCGYVSYFNRAAVVTHFRAVHERWRCELCDATTTTTSSSIKGFKSARELRNHQGRCHRR